VWGTADPSPLARRRFDAMLGLLTDRRYGRALEVGCGPGIFSRMLAPHVDHLRAVDVSAEAVALAKRAGDTPANVSFEVADIMEYDLHAEGPWDLVVASEMWPYLGWMYSFYFVGWLASEIFAASASGARLMMVDTSSGAEDELLEPWLIATYRDLMQNVGYEREGETRLQGEEAGSEFEFLLTVFIKP